MTFDPLALNLTAARTMRPVIRGSHHAVSTRKPQATQAAERVLRSGGNAFDAAVAAQAVLSVVDPAMTGIGGDVNVLIYDAATKKIVSLNGSGPAPHLATIDWYRQNAGGRIPVNDGLLSASMPTVVDACYVLLDRWGTMTFTDLLAPAIELAEEGFPVSEYLVEYFVEHAPKLRKYETTARVYLPDGRILKAGEKLRNPDLARTLKKLVEAEQAHWKLGRQAALQAARDRFYKGDIARTLSQFCEQNGGLYRYQDLARYTVKLEAPVSVNYRGHQVYKNPSANQGPVELMLLNLLEGYDLAALGHNSPDYIHLCVEAAKLAFADRECLGDTDFITIPFDRLLSKDYARDRRDLIDMRRASHEFRPGSPIAVNSLGEASHVGDTSYLAVVDQHRNGVSFTPSLHSAFGTGVVLGDLGFMLNCRGDYYSLDPDHPNSLEPGKRARSTLTPSIVMKDGKLYMVIGSPGGDEQPTRIAQTLLNHIDFGMNIQEAIEAPRWSTTSFPASEFPHNMYPGNMALESRIPEGVRADLADRGHNVEVKGPWMMSATSAIVIDPATGVLSAGADPRGDNYALAW
ncbi:MAG TPA: gamma-glutamyltransferase [Bryobacteraceae bacterium]|jgi:gamma-glutamyltranspeptidase/glutathione hydrolase